MYLLVWSTVPSSKNFNRFLFISPVRGVNNFDVVDWGLGAVSFGAIPDVNNELVTDCGRVDGNNMSDTGEKTDAVTDLGRLSFGFTVTGYGDWVLTNLGVNG